MAAPERSAEELLHELQVHQTELEKQNESLRQAQVALEESRDRYLDLYEFAPVGYLTLEESGRIAEANLTAATLLGIERKALLGRRFDLLVVSGNRDRWRHHFIRALESEAQQRFKLNLEGGQGLLIHVDLRCRLMRGMGAKILRVVMNDISELDRLQEALRLSEARFRLLSAASFEGIAITEKGCIVDANDQLSSMLGYGREELIGRQVAQLIPPEERQKVLENIQADRESCIEHTLIRRDGRQIQVEAHGRSLDREQRPVRITALRDITERRRAEETLRLAHARFQRLVDANIVGVAIASTRGEIFTANDYYLDILGFSRQELETGSARWLDITPPEWLHADEAAIADLRTTGVCRPYEKEYLRRDGSRVAVDIALAMLPGPEEQVLAVALDASERKRTQRDLEQANSELTARTRQAEEMNAAKTRFLSSISHELRTPLHTILGYVRLLLKETEGEARTRLEIVERSGSHLLKLIEDLLEFNHDGSHVDELQPEEVVLRMLMSLLEHTGRLMARDNGNRFSVKLADNLPQAVWADDQRLRQVLKNLIANACKYTRNGTVTLFVARDDHEAQTTDGRHCRLRFEVGDDGVGIAPEEQEHIFEAFHRGDLAHGVPGLGLGLAIAQQWVKAMGGAIQVQSAPGQGSRFFFTLELPVAVASPHIPATSCDAFRERLASTARTVLIADDVEENRLYLRDLCERWGYKVLEADNGDSALATCMTSTSSVHALLVDQFMPGMDGWGVLGMIRRIPELCHLPVVLISASEAQRPGDVSPDLEFDLCLGKPLDEQALACFLCRRLGLADPLPQCCPLVCSSAETAFQMALPAEESAAFKEMLRFGRVFQIEEWAKGLAAKDSAYTAFSGQVVQYCRMADLPALEKLAETSASAQDATRRPDASILHPRDAWN